MEKRLELPRNEMAFRKIYRELLEEKKITTIFRPEKRLCEDFRGYCEKQEVYIRLLDRVGADWAGVAPKFVDGFEMKVVIKTVEVKKISELTQGDFSGSSPDIFDAESLKYHLGVVYNLDPSQLSGETVITRTTFEYV